MIFIEDIYFSRDNFDFGVYYRARRRVFFITISSSSFIRLLVFYSSYDGLVFGITVDSNTNSLDIYNLNACGSGAYNFPI